MKQRYGACACTLHPTRYKAEYGVGQLHCRWRVACFGLLAWQPGSCMQIRHAHELVCNDEAWAGECVKSSHVCFTCVNTSTLQPEVLPHCSLSTASYGQSYDTHCTGARRFQQCCQCLGFLLARALERLIAPGKHCRARNAAQKLTAGRARHCAIASVCAAGCAAMGRPEQASGPAAARPLRLVRPAWRTRSPGLAPG